MILIPVMTNKDWYVLHQTKKFGPFARQQILEMLKTGSVMRSQKVWKEGLDEPITSYELFLDSVNAKANQTEVKPTEAIQEEIAEADAELFAKFGYAFDLNTTFDANVDTFNLDGQQVK